MYQTKSLKLTCQIESLIMTKTVTYETESLICQLKSKLMTHYFGVPWLIVIHSTIFIFYTG